MKHIRAGALALKLLGVILVIFGGLDIVRCLLGMFSDNNSIAYLSSLMSSGFLLLIGIAMMIAASVIKKKFIK